MYSFTSFPFLEWPWDFVGDLLVAGRADSAMLNGITTHAPTDGADHSYEGSSGKNWFGTVNRLHYTFRPSRVEFLGTRTNFTRARTTFSEGPSTGEILGRQE